MKFCFRADASLQIGSGHVIRCLTIADALVQQGHESFFVCRQHPGHLIEFVRQRGYKVYALTEAENNISESGSEYQRWLGVTEQQDADETVAILKKENADWVVVDHYALSVNWQKVVRQSFKLIRVAVIDDLANRLHDADIILDCGLANTVLDYEQINQRAAQYLIGAKYALLRPEFHEKRLWLEQNPRVYDSEYVRVLINLGGVDKDNLTGAVLDILSQSNNLKALNVTVVMGLNAPYRDSVIKQAENLPFRNKVLINANNMADLMAEHDLAIGAAGSTAWERCCLGLPTVMICMADNQKMIAQHLDRLGAAISLDQTEIEEKLLAALELAQVQTEQMQQNAYEITDGLGVDYLLKVILSREFPA
ncbi:UDP-2,4-diacetamido-2,4,6-trideoxy-beta-L-altropyranose hydrolase [Acinetobacter sp. Ac_5812]|uniref:UDP-2,4-diacetamido-2,4, 6-trideoxy-beta-L-altropyranose hydrolase n=1 Tax=Acinetobacter sp. Ac_5812 TaxID=1848937 RepID=UPI00148FF8D3|nr:UDP-2,4-diacetamido-2,4,6-trideoxy-beta-L-altropyranose hydrolase [Acinetobacter sp. Ac_5812]NNP69397.1 UDP-2,4-diacetamido-2,4,6-trideoxy-beta-L-altropyranose hydrolase [Acinetobacter sp. Ac_5812]